MAKFIISLIAAVAFCYLAEAVTSGDYHAAINRVATLERQSAQTRLNTALAPSPASTPLAHACIGAVRARSYREINLALVAVENQLRADAATKTDADLAAVTLEQVTQQVTDAIHSAVDAVVTRLEGEAANCQV
uniref:Uncharacterized protein n=1 Tax=Riptortus pedestris TaxID=329032 RepID=R4WNK2_RIPPE|nr:unknown secreted protein [Riptortus pedestris]